MRGTYWLEVTDLADSAGFCLTIGINCVVLLLVRNRCKHIGAYKYLMTTFSIFSIVYACIESMLRPVMHIENTTYFLISRKRFNYPTRIAKINSALYCACFAATFILPAVHFIYRYFAACRPEMLFWFNGKRLLIWPIFAGVPIACWASVSYFLYPDSEFTERAVEQVLKEHYGGLARNQVSYIAYIYYIYEDDVRYFNKINIFGCFVHYFVMSLAFFVMGFCGFSTFDMIRKHRGVSNRTRHLQNQLFHALVLQTIIPSIFMYIPTGIMFIFPFLNINLYANANFIVTCSYLYPAIDPLITIIIIQDFKQTVMKVILGKGSGSISTAQSSSILAGRSTTFNPRLSKI